MMIKETKIQITQRKIRNGLRKQATVIQHQKEKIWDKLKEVHDPRRKLKAGWTVEQAVDLESMHSLDIETEIVESIAKSIVADIDKDILMALSKEQEVVWNKLKNPWPPGWETPPVIGSSYFDMKDSKMYVYDGVKWHAVA